MNALLTKLRKLNIELSLEDNRLKINAPEKAITRELLEEIRRDKELLIEYISSLSRKTGFSGIEKAGEKDFYVLSSAQKRLYFLYELDKTSTAYNSPQVVSLYGQPDRERLNRALNVLMARHESLRTSFHLSGEHPVQKIHDHVDFSIAQFPAREEDLEEQIRRFIRPFDLSKAPLFRVALFRVSPEEHILVVDTHHILTDGITRGILIREFMGLYRGERLPAIEIRYRDFAEWQQSEGQMRRTDGQKEFWLTEFAGETGVLDLPVDFPRPGVKNYEGDSIRFELSREETAGIRRLAENENASTFMVLLAAYSILLGKLASSEEVVIGTTTAGRQQAGLENVMGMFVNTLPLRIHPRGELNFRPFLQALKSKILACMDNQAFPYEALVDELQVVRTAGRNPLFDVLFLFHNFELAELKIPGLTLKPLEIVHKTALFDLSLSVIETEGRLRMDMEYATSLFNRSTIERFITYFKKTIASIVANPEMKILDIDILSREERHLLLYEFNHTKAAYPAEETLVSLFEAQVERTPENAAVSCGDKVLTYRELKHRSGQVAAYLVEVYGIGPGDLIGVMLEREEWLIPSIFGILKSGGAYVPIDPTYPPERIHSIVVDSGIKALITRGKYVRTLINRPLWLVDLDLVEDEIRALQIKPQNGRLKGNDLAYVIYTSGSTGSPKGVMIEHHSVINRIAWAQKTYPIDSGDVLLQKTPVVFDVSVWELFWWSFTGASLYLLRPEGEKDPLEIMETIRARKITVIHFVPPMLGAFLSALDKRFPIAALSSLRLVFVSGESLPPELVDAFGHKVNNDLGTRLINLYGPTEATIEVSCYECGFGAPNAVIPIGKPIDNTQLYILDQWLQPVPFGVRGELCIGGVGLARGYLYKEGLTAEKFIVYPGAPGERIYKTGDLASWMVDGNIRFLGRRDSQVKIRGFRIELGEIEHKLAAHEEVRQCVVLVKERGGEKFLTAYYVAGREIEAHRLEAFLSEKLPGFMLPAYYVQLKHLPLNANGKLDRAAFPEPVTDTGNDGFLPSTEMEEKLAGIWSEVLKIDEQDIGVDKSFFELGGHSIRAIYLINKIRQAFPVKIGLRDIFENASIRKLALLITKAKDGSVSLIPRVEKREYYPASPAQARLFYRQLLNETSLAYNISGVFRAKPEIDVDRLRKSFRALLDRHPSLKARFLLSENNVIQLIEQDNEPEFVILDQKKYGNIEAAFDDFARPFDVTRGLLFRCGLICFEEMEPLLLIDIHHIVCDGFSLNILMNDFMKIYQGEELPAPQLTYLDYACWQNSASFHLEKQKRFWEKRLSGKLSFPDLPVRRDRSTVSTHSADSRRLVIDREEYSVMKKTASLLNVSDFMFLLSIYYLLLSKITGNQDIIVGTDALGRTHPDLKEVAGTFVNLLPLRVQLPSGGSYREFVEIVKETVLEAFSNQDFQFDQMVTLVKRNEKLQDNPIVQVHFAFANFFYAGTEGGDPVFVPLPLKERLATDYEFKLEAKEANQGLQIAFVYSKELYDASFVEILTGYYHHILQAVLRDVSIPLGDIKLTNA